MTGLKLYFLIQKLIGVCLVGLSILAAVLLKEGTVGLIFAPWGLYLIFTKRLWIS